MPSSHARSLGTAFPHILSWLEDVPLYSRRHRVLVVPLPDDGTLVALSPDFEAEAVDFRALVVLRRERAAPGSLAVGSNIYAFDTLPAPPDSVRDGWEALGRGQSMVPMHGSGARTEGLRSR